MSWWRSQRVALLSLVVAAAALVGATLWLDVMPGIRPGDRVIEAGSRADISGQTLSLGAVEWGEFESPEGTRTLSVRLHASGGSDATLCGAATLTETASSRSWLSSRTGLDVPYDEGESSCVAESSAYRILLVFLLPDDAVGPFQLDVEGDDADLARFIVEP